MGIYKNDYNKNEDAMMYELHEIRNKLSKENKNINQINKKAEEIIKKYKLKNLKIEKKTNFKDKILIR
jgi:hypothetical protein